MCKSRGHEAEQRKELEVWSWSIQRQVQIAQCSLICEFDGVDCCCCYYCYYSIPKTGTSGENGHCRVCPGVVCLAGSQERSDRRCGSRASAAGSKSSKGSLGPCGIAWQDGETAHCVTSSTDTSDDGMLASSSSFILLTTDASKGIASAPDC